jgi:uncharacterized protein (DUF983 family)
MSYIILSFLVAPFLLRSLRGRARHCPACLRLSRVRYFGRYHCAACGRDFILDHAGRAVPTLWQAAFGPLVTWLVVFLSILGLDFWIQGSLRQAPWISLAFVPYLLFYLSAAFTKGFPANEHAA